MSTPENTSGTVGPGYAAAGAKDGILTRLALDKVAPALVDEHTGHCVLGAAPEHQEEMRAELMTALGRLVGRR